MANPLNPYLYIQPPKQDPVSWLEQRMLGGCAVNARGVAGMWSQSKAKDYVVCATFISGESVRAILIPNLETFLDFIWEYGHTEQVTFYAIPTERMTASSGIRQSVIDEALGKNESDFINVPA